MTHTVRTRIEWVLQQLIEAEATAVIGAAPHERTAERSNQRNGHRPRLLSTAAGDVESKTCDLRAMSPASQVRARPSCPSRSVSAQATTGAAQLWSGAVRAAPPSFV
jgi:hypothetical protein